MERFMTSEDEVRAAPDNFYAALTRMIDGMPLHGNVCHERERNSKTPRRRS